MALSVPSALASRLPGSFRDVPSLTCSTSHSHPSSSSISCSICSSSSYSSIGDIPNPSVSLNHRMPWRLQISRVRASSLSEDPLKVIISGAPASGKGTQCELIVKKYGLVHISTGDLLRAQVSSETKVGLMVKKYMDKRLLVPDDIVTDIVKARMSQKDAKERGWLLDGYPRTLIQAQSLENNSIRPDVFILLEVPDEVLVDRSVGRRMDPITGKIYHLKYFPPESPEISSRIVTRPDDMEEKVKARIEAYLKNLVAVSSVYTDLLVKIDGNRHKKLVFESIDVLLSNVKNDKAKMLNKVQFVENVPLNVTALRKANWRGIPTRLNNIPHSKEIREYFYDDVLQATQRAIEAKQTRLKVEINIPELNPEMDVYRIGTLMELVRVLALSFADDGKYVKVCVQGSMGEGALSGMPLQLAGSRRILEFMDWGEHGALGTFVNIGSIGAQYVSEQDDIFIIVAPQNAVGNCIIDDLRALTDEAGDRPVILVNPRLKDLPSSSGIMQTMGREERMVYSSTFQNCYLFRLLYYAGTLYPIMGALRMSYPYEYELYRRVDDGFGKEKYVVISMFPERPTPLEINDAFEGKPRRTENSTGLWGFLSSIF